MTPVMDKMDVATLPPPMLDSKLASLLRICRDFPKEQVWRTALFGRMLVRKPTQT